MTLLSSSKTAFLSILGIGMLVTSCAQPSAPVTPPAPRTEPLSIYVQDDYLISTSHMIGGPHISIIDAKITKNSHPSAKVVQSIKNSDIIIVSRATQKALLKDILTDYKGKLLDLSPVMEDSNTPRTESDFLKQIAVIRDSFDESDPGNHGYFFDHAGDYTHIMSDTYDTLHDRMKQYNLVPFVTLGESMENVINNYGLKEYHKGHFDVAATRNDDFITDLESTLASNDTRIVFVGYGVSKSVVDSVAKLGVQIYSFPLVTEDISAWGYINYLGQLADTFVKAFDTYD